MLQTDRDKPDPRGEVSAEEHQAEFLIMGTLEANCSVEQLSIFTLFYLFNSNND